MLTQVDLGMFLKDKADNDLKLETITFSFRGGVVQSIVNLPVHAYFNRQN